MEHSRHYAMVKGFYDMKLWNIKKVWDAVGRWITADEYKEITGADYPETRPE